MKKIFTTYFVSWSNYSSSQACVYARFLCEKAGVKFILGRPQGQLESLVVEGSGSSKKVTGIKTCDGLTHDADLVVVACEYTHCHDESDHRLMSSQGGPWSSTVIPEAHRSVEATMGTLMFVDVPAERKDLRERFHPSKFPIWRFLQGEGDGSVLKNLETMR